MGILDLDIFTRALRLRWLWFQWKQNNRAWTSLEIPCDRVDRDLFYASTIVTIGDGKWPHSGHQTGHKEPLQDQFATLLYVKTRRKKINVHQGLTNDKWIDHIFPSTTQEEVIQFVRLWEATRGVVLRDTEEDCITWRWTANGEYTTSSAYQIQGLFGSCRTS